jgi:uncharacterized OB-fold protein
MSEQATTAAMPESPEQRFLAELATGTAKVQQCAECGQKFFQPRTHCPHCRSPRYSWAPLSMTGVLHSYTNLPAQKDRAAYNVVLVDMADGFRMMSTCPGMELDMSAIGQQLVAQIDLGCTPARIVFGAAA